MPDFSPILQYMLDNNNSEHMDKATQTDFSEFSSTKQLTTPDKAGIPKLKVARSTEMETSSSSPPNSISAMSITGSPPPTSPSSPTLDIVDADPEMEETQSDMSLVMEEEEKEEGKKEPKKKSERDHQLIGLMNKEKQQQQQMPEELQQSELLHKSDGDGDWRQMILDMVMDASTWLKLPEQGFFRIFLVGNF